MSPNFYITPRPEDPNHAILSLWLGTVKLSAAITGEDARELCDVLAEYLKTVEVKT